MPKEITSCLERLLFLACSTASSAAWITWSKGFLWCFAASFSDHSQHSASRHDLVMASTGVSSSRSLWLCWGDSLSGLSLGSLDGWHSGPSCSCPSLVGCESLWGFSPDSSFLVWWVCDRLSCEWLVSAHPWYFFFNTLMRWSRLDREACVFLCALAEDSTNFLLQMLDHPRCLRRPIFLSDSDVLSVIASDHHFHFVLRDETFFPVL